MTSFCAICASDHGAMGTVDLDGRTYVACEKCIGEHPRDRGHHDSFRGYQPRHEDSVMTVAEFRRAVDTFARNVKMPPMQFDHSPTHYPLPAGEELVRVPMRADDKPIDAEDAMSTLLDRDYEAIAYRGTSHGYHVFGVRRSA